ncbi:MAG: hypothetical protein LQ338_002806 [Usnochroma carphineum]|nr:MAG: hypothetical protein LQ338_002806 [Usnochroma carphineum]
MPSTNFPSQRHQPNWPKPPTSALDTKGLRERKEYADRVWKNYRGVSPRLFAFIIDLGQRCCDALQGERKVDKKENMAVIVMNDSMLQSRWEAEESPEGLWQGILDVLDAFTEQRMTIDYGDYLAVSLEQYKRNDMTDLSWNGIPWTDVAELLDNEEGAMELWLKTSRDPKEKPERPFYDAVLRAAGLKKLPPGQVVFEIKEYAKRNNQCHNGLRDLIDKAAWTELADLTARDKQRLQEIYRNDPYRG